jgi:hypothetical protein
MKFVLGEETLLPEGFSLPTQRASRHQPMSQVVFVEEIHFTDGTTTQQPATTKMTIVDSILWYLKATLLALAVMALLVVAFAVLQYFLMSAHLISDPRYMLW